jgi:hypothetical protein
MQKLFDTMALAGVKRASGPTWNEVTLGRLKQHVRFFNKTSPARRFDRSHAPGANGKLVGGDAADDTAIWGFETTPELGVVNVTCRVRDDKWNRYQVLDRLEWGFADVQAPVSAGDVVHGVGSFSKHVRVKLNGRGRLDLPLTDEFRLTTVVTFGAKTVPGDHPMWPITAVHDWGFLHVFAYDIDPDPDGKFSAIPQSDVTEFRTICDRINDAELHSVEKAKDVIFQDNVWTAPIAASAAPSGAAPSVVPLVTTGTRVVVVCSLVVCRERDDYQPGDPMGVGRLLPHVMVISTHDLEAVEAGVRFQRPQFTRILDGKTCGCDEMLFSIGSMLVTDSNADNMVISNPLNSGPLVFMANLFNYYMIDPHFEPDLQDKAIQVVHAESDSSRNVERHTDAVSRNCSDVTSRTITHVPRNIKVVRKVRRQGAFDNIHVSPKMVVTPPLREAKFSGIAGGQGGTATFTDLKTWKMDEVAMAPFCAHDCFHMHWRWSDNVNIEPATWGFDQGQPCKSVGRVMVPENQAVFIVMSSTPGKVSYLAKAEKVPADEWQIVCHHGAGYGLSVGFLVNRGKEAQRFLAGTAFVGPAHTFPQPADKPDRRRAEVEWDDWALFYWVNRFTLNKPATGQVEVFERFSFTNRKAALAL